MNTTERNREVQQRIVKAVSTVNKDYVAGNAPEWSYPLLDGDPPRGKKLNLLTSGGMSVIGPWSDNSNYIAWAPLIKSSKIKEHMVKLLQNFSGSSMHKAVLQAIFRYHAQTPVQGLERLYDVVSAFLETYPNNEFFQASPTYAYQVSLVDQVKNSTLCVNFTHVNDSIWVDVAKPSTSFSFSIPHDTEFNAQALSDIIYKALHSAATSNDVENEPYELRGEHLFLNQGSDLSVGPLQVYLDTNKVLRESSARTVNTQ